MSQQTPPPERPNSLGKASLVLGIISVVLIFFVGTCVNIAGRRGHASDMKNLVEIFGGTFALIGLIAVGLGIGGLFGKNRSRTTAIAGLILGAVALVIAASLNKMVR